MSKTPEGKVKDRVKKLLEASHCYFFMPIGGAYSRAGIPDIVACVHGHFLCIECKSGKNKPTALQESEMQHIRDAGGTAIMVNEANIDTLEAWLEGNAS